jgi:hypothetical protein
MSLQIWLPLNGNLENKGLSDINITGANLTIDTNGKIGSCYSFNGSNSSLLISNAPVIKEWTESTVCFWIKNATNAAQCIINHRTSVGKGLAVFIVSNKIRIDTDTSMTTFDYVCNFSQWMHVAIVSKTGTRQLYINGELIETKNVTGTITYQSSGTYASIGGSSTNTTTVNSNWLQGLLNDFRLYDEALSPMQIKLISQGLVAHYLLNNNGSGNNNLVIGSNTDSLNTNVWRYSMQTGGNTKSIELDETNTYCVKIERDNTTHSGWSFLGYDNFLRDKIKTNTPYVLTFDCNASVAGSITFSNLMNSNTTNGMVLVSSIQQIQKDVIANQWNHMVYKFITKDSFDDIQIQTQIIYLSVSTSLKDTGVVLKFKNIKLEYGDKSTSWCPNPEDSIYTQLGYNNNIEYDVSGYCNNGTKYNIVDYVSDSPRYSASTKFNGTNSYINVGRGGMVKDEITINVWAYMDDWTKYNSRLISCTEGGGWNFEPVSGKIHFAIGTGSTSNTYKNTSGYTLSELSSGWHMFTGTYDGFTTKQYVDGILNTTNNAYTTKTPIFYHASNPILIGAEASSTQNPAGYYFNGYLSDVRIYATALSESDIQSLYNNSAFIDSSGNVYSTEYIEE